MHRFKLLAFMGFMLSCVASAGLVYDAVAAMPYRTAVVLERACLILGAGGILVSVFALAFGKAAGATFRVAPRAYLAGWIGIILPIVVAALWRLRLIG